MKLISHTPATSTTAEAFEILGGNGVRYTVRAPFEIKGLFKRDWSAYRGGRGAQYVTHTKPGQQAIELAKALQQQ